MSLTRIAPHVLLAWPTMTPDPLVGKTLGSFEILEVVGQGGMAMVYKARQRHEPHRGVESSLHADGG